MAVVVSIDAGTTGIRAFAVDAAGRPCGRVHREFTQHFPRPGWVEHDAAEIWHVTCAVLAELRAALGDEPVAAIGITDQRETVVAWDRRDGRPLAPAPVWQDRRTAARCEELEAAGLLPLVRERTGLVLDPYFSATKIEWLLRHGVLDPSADLAFGTIDSWLVWNLTGGRTDAGACHVTDASNASRTMLYDLRRGAWDPDLCARFGVREAQLPELRPSAGVLGRVAPGRPFAGTPIAGVLGDQQAALFGQACLAPGMAKNTYGTGSFVLANVGERCPAPVDGLLTTVAWDLDGRRTYAYEGAIFVTGAAVQWLRDGLGIIAAAADIGPLAASVDDPGGVVFVPALTGLGSPWWDPHARGTILGITRGTTRAHLARAALEAIAFQTRDVVTTMVAAAGVPLTELRVDGGAAANALLLETQADQLGVPVVRAAVAETTALGAAYAAGIGAGVWTIDDVRANWTADARVAPRPDRRAAADAAHERWCRAVACVRAFGE